MKTLKHNLGEWYACREGLARVKGKTLRTAIERHTHVADLIWLIETLLYEEEEAVFWREYRQDHLHTVENVHVPSKHLDNPHTCEAREWLSTTTHTRLLCCDLELLKEHLLFPPVLAAMNRRLRPRQPPRQLYWEV